MKKSACMRGTPAVVQTFQSYFDTGPFNLNKQSSFRTQFAHMFEGIIVFRIMASSLRACFCKIASRFVQYFVNNPKSLSIYLFLFRSCVSGPHEGLHPLHLRDELPSRHPHPRNVHCCQVQEFALVRMTKFNPLPFARICAQ